MQKKKNTTQDATSNLKSPFDALPDDGYIRERQLVASHKHPGEPFVLPFSSATLWRKVKEGSFPSPSKFSTRITCWRVGDVRAWLSLMAA